MKRVFLGLAVALALASAADKKQMFTGVNSDTTCGAKHAMNIRPDDKSVRECVTTDPKKWKYALLVEPEIFALSDQRTPGTFAGQRVKVTGMLFEKPRILQGGQHRDSKKRTARHVGEKWGSNGKLSKEV